MPTVASDRRSFLAACATLGISTTLLPGLLWGQMAQAGAVTVTPELVDQMAEVAGLTITPDERDAMVRTFNQQMNSLDALRKIPLANWDPPALIFSPVLPEMEFPTAKLPTKLAPVTGRGDGRLT